SRVRSGAEAKAVYKGSGKPDGLAVKQAIGDEGTNLKRRTERARGSGSGILKRTSHIRIVLSDEISIETRETKKAKREQEKKDSKKQATAGEMTERSTSTAKTRAKSKSRKKKTKR